MAAGTCSHETVWSALLLFDTGPRQEELSEESDGEALAAKCLAPSELCFGQGEQITVEELEQWKETLAEED